MVDLVENKIRNKKQLEKNVMAILLDEEPNEAKAAGKATETVYIDELVGYTD